MEVSRSAQFVKRTIDSILNDMEEEERTRPRKVRKLNPAGEQVDPSRLANNKQKLREEDHSPELEPEEDAAKLSAQETLQSEAAEKPPKKKSPMLTRTQLTKTQSELKRLQASLEDMEQQMKKHKEQQEDAIGKAVEIALDDKVGNALDQVDAVLAEEVRKVVAERLPKEVKRVVDARMPEEIKKVQEAIAKDADKALKEAIANNNTTFEQMIAEFKEGVAQELRELHDSRQKSREQYEKLAELAKVHEATMAEVKKATDQAIIHMKEADDKIQHALNGKEAAESAMAGMHKDLRRHNQFLEKQQAHFGFERRNSHVARTKHRHAKQQFRQILAARRCECSEDRMQVDALPVYIPPSQSGTPESLSPNFFNSSASSINTATAEKTGLFTDVHIPRPSVKWTSGSKANPFANWKASKVGDADNTSMYNHSRDGFSSELYHNNKPDEQSPTPSASSSLHRPSQPPAQQLSATFGRASVGHLPGLNGAGQSNHGHAPSPPHTQQAPAQWYPTPPSNKNMSSSYGTPTPAQNNSSRNPRPVNNSNDVQHSNSGYAASQSRNQGGFAPAGPARLNGPAQSSSSHAASQSHNQSCLAQGVPAPPNGPAQQVDVYAPGRLTRNNQRIAADENLRRPSQGQPQQSQRGSTTNGHGGARNGRGGALGGRGGARGGRGGSRNGHGNARDQPYDYDGDDEHDRRSARAATRQHGANGAPKQPKNPFASQSSPSSGTVIPRIGDSFDEIANGR